MGKRRIGMNLVFVLFVILVLGGMYWLFWTKDGAEALRKFLRAGNIEPSA